MRPSRSRRLDVESMRSASLRYARLSRLALPIARVRPVAHILSASRRSAFSRSLFSAWRDVSATMDKAANANGTTDATARYRRIRAARRLNSSFRRDGMLATPLRTRRQPRMAGEENGAPMSSCSHTRPPRPVARGDGQRRRDGLARYAGAGAPGALAASPAQGSRAAADASVGGQASGSALALPPFSVSA